MEDAAVGQMDFDLVGRRMANDVPIGEHVVLGAELHDDAGAGFFDVEQALKLGQRLRFDVDDGGRDQLHDAFDDAEFAVQAIRRRGRAQRIRRRAGWASGVATAALAAAAGAGVAVARVGELRAGGRCRAGTAHSEATTNGRAAFDERVAK